MSENLSTDEDRDDAAFRARLAPLASEVLPGARTPRSAPPSSVPPIVERAGIFPSAEPSASVAGRSNPRRPLIARAESVAAEAAPGMAGKPGSHRKIWRRIALSLGLLAIAVAGVGWLSLRGAGGGGWFAIGRALVVPSVAPPSVPAASASMSLAPPTRSAPIASMTATPAAPVRPAASDPENASAAATTPANATSAPFVRTPDRAVTTEPEGSPAVTPAADMVGLLMRRGDAALAEGDIIAARLMFERAASLGSAAAATAAGKTYDIDFLLRSGARGIRADQAAAARWYRRAAALGDAEARARLARPDKPVTR